MLFTVFCRIYNIFGLKTILLFWAPGYNLLHAAFARQFSLQYWDVLCTFSSPYYCVYTLQTFCSVLQFCSVFSALLYNCFSAVLFSAVLLVLCFTIL